MSRKPSSAVLESFNLHFTSENAVVAQKSSNLLLIGVEQVRGVFYLGESSGHQSSKIVKNVRNMSEGIIQHIDTCIAQFGLIDWCPDLTQSPNSLYNLACRLIAIETFKQAMMAHTYASLRPNRAYINDHDLIFRLYNHIVHYYFHSRFIRNLNNPGTVMAGDDANGVYRNRKRVRDSFFSFLKPI
jgi:hypothetical protein